MPARLEPAEDVALAKITVVRSVAALRRLVAGWNHAGERVALVPTMGALHEGHISLVRAARRRAHRVVVSIFVNPTQFAPTEDLSKYPRTFAADRDKLTEAKADLIFAPDATEMYPAGFATTVSLAGPAAVGLEDAFRPTHFAGVATVVCKLFTQCRPHVALFGEKDFQQLKVVTHMARDLDLGVQVIGAPTVRDPDGLAMSSRNRFLGAQERTTALTLHRTMVTEAAAIRAGEPVEAALARGRAAICNAGFVLDYLALREAENLLPVALVTQAPLRLLVAARIGSTRLIDNIGV
ncbi:MAG: pantoate--beta-alanine ligase [Bosea sp.]|jgi:pantoate--beta-alanine ligase|nr:pantoate--beta-alanine ligase [Bosea sp. (in: a-proteobacteria)]